MLHFHRKFTALGWLLKPRGYKNFNTLIIPPLLKCTYSCDFNLTGIRATPSAANEPTNSQSNT
jgi:hypothetical protein